MKDVLMQTYIIALPILLGYIVWLLQEQKKKQVHDAKERENCVVDRAQHIFSHPDCDRRYRNFTGSCDKKIPLADCNRRWGVSPRLEDK